MEALSKKIGQLKKADYDQRVFTFEEISKKINSETARNLKFCEEFGITGFDIVASELIHSKEELSALQKEKPSFREANKNDEKIIELKELVSELEALLIEKTGHANRLKAHKANELAHEESVKALTPLADALKEIDKKMKDAIADIRILETSHLPNPINGEVFRVMNEMARPGGIG